MTDAGESTVTLGGKGALASRPPTVSVVIPTYNEAENLPELLTRLASVLAEVDHEIIVVDDNSPDGTWQLAQDWPDDRVRSIRRVNERGLSSAILTGMQAARGQQIAVMDADLQHDEAILPTLLEQVATGADLAVGSRKAAGGSFGDWSASRRFVSWVATQLANLVVRNEVTDPMSGYFVTSRTYLRSVEDRLNPRGFKILLEMLARGKPKVVEVGYSFRSRERGETKLSSGVIIDYLLALVQLRFGPVVSDRFVRYASVGLGGFAVNVVGYLLARLLGIGFVASVVIGFECSIVFNYLVNMRWTFGLRLRGLRRVLRGFVIYRVFSSYALLVQAAVFEALRGRDPFSAMDRGGMLLANLVAIGMAAISNYFIHSNFTWKLLARSQAVVGSED